MKQDKHGRKLVPGSRIKTWWRHWQGGKTQGVTLAAFARRIVKDPDNGYTKEERDIAAMWLGSR